MRNQIALLAMGHRPDDDELPERLWRTLRPVAAHGAAPSLRLSSSRVRLECSSSDMASMAGGCGIPWTPQGCLDQAAPRAKRSLATALLEPRWTPLVVGRVRLGHLCDCLGRGALFACPLLAVDQQPAQPSPRKPGMLLLRTPACDVLPRRKLPASVCTHTARLHESSTDGCAHAQPSTEGRPRA
jgi:hypothetical protein